jgi:hypothetical protein
MTAGGADFSPGGRLAQHGEIGVGQHCQSDMTMPAGPRAHFVLVQPDLALGYLKATLDSPAHARHPYQLGQGRRRRGECQIEGEFFRLFDFAADQQAFLPAGSDLRRAVGQIGPVVQPRSLGAVAGREALPRLGRCVFEPVGDRFEAEPPRVKPAGFGLRALVTVMT